MKKAYILPGWTQSYDENTYQIIATYFSEHGYEATIDLPDWNKHGISQWVDDFLETTEIGEPVTILGFSMGALIALVASSKLRVENMILCSPSGYFQEYVSLLTDDDLSWARANILDFEAFSAVDVINKVKVTNGYVVAGENELKEWPEFKQWIADLTQQTKWRSSVIANTGHEIEAASYLEVIKGIIDRLP